MENQLLWGLWIVFGAYILYKVFQPRPSDYEAELEEILTNEAYKVKGKYGND